MKFNGLGHVNIVVENISQASLFYERIFGAIPKQEFPNFKNEGFAKSAEFLIEPEKVEVSIKFLEIPSTNLFLELMEYHYPKWKKFFNHKNTNDIGGIGHICLKVIDIEKYFNFIKNQPDINLISNSEKYRPFKIDKIKTDQFHFLDKESEKNINKKNEVCNIVGQIRYFYFIDKYGIQWEFEEGHDDIGK